MTPAERIQCALASALRCPGLAAETLLAHQKEAAVLVQLEYLRRRSAPLVLPDTDACRTVADQFGVQVQWLAEGPGIYSLSTAPFGSGERIGLVRKLVGIAGSGRAANDFAAGCLAGERAAKRWLIGVVGLFRAGPLVFHSMVLPPQSGSDASVALEGPSVGLAASLAATTKWLGDESVGQAVAATGCVAPDGRVLRVDGLSEKLRAVGREAPFIEKVLVPADQKNEIPDGLRSSLSLCFVSHVDEALALIFGIPRVSQLHRLDRSAAAELAVEMEVAGDHARAADMAEVLVQSFIDSPADPTSLGDCTSELLARTIWAANLNHTGFAKEAREQFGLVESMLGRADNRVAQQIAQGKFRVLRAVSEASVLIDLLEPEKAATTCEALLPRAGMLDGDIATALLGSRARALAAAGYLDEALAASQEQLGRLLEPKHEGQMVQAACNRFDILLRLHRQRGENIFDEAWRLFARAESCNLRLPEGTQKDSNNTYLAFWKVRLLAAEGNAAEAAQCAGPVPAEGGHPSLHAHRFVAQAQAEAGEVQGAIDRLAAVIAVIRPGTGPFEALILHTASARLACVLIDDARSGWEAPAREFLLRLRNWHSNYVELEEQAWDDAKVVRAVLEEAMARLPY